MKKKDLLHALRRIGLEDEIVFATTGEELDPKHAFVVTGMRGLVLVLSESPEVAGRYDDAETASSWPQLVPCRARQLGKAVK